MTQSVAIFIPSRLNSSRFPRKVLTPINGVPMVVYIFRKAQKLDIGPCYVACCSKELKEIVEENGGQAILTDPDLPSGTDRVFAAMKVLDKQFDIVVNLQGDMPVFEGEMIRKIVDVMQRNAKAEIDMATPVRLVANSMEKNNPNQVKVIFENMEKRKPGRAIYFSREAIPHCAKEYFHHIGMYAYTRNAIEKFVHTKQSYLEKTERLEQLRCLENHMNVWAVPVDGVAHCVDVKEDLDVIKCCI